MTAVTMHEMLETGVHLGHQTRNWHPRMAPYLYGERNRIHIIDLEKTLPLFNAALNFLGDAAARKQNILFVATKPPARLLVREEAQRCGMPYVNVRWLGGLLTNLKVVTRSVQNLTEMEQFEAEEGVESMNKRQAQAFRRELGKLRRLFSGIRELRRCPDLLFIIDANHERNALCEARKLGIPVVAVVDSNTNPEGVDYVIPGNDDSERAIRLYLKAAADAILESRRLREEQEADQFLEVSPGEQESATVEQRS